MLKDELDWTGRLKICYTSYVCYKMIKKIEYWSESDVFVVFPKYGSKILTRDVTHETAKEAAAWIAKERGLPEHLVLFTKER